MPAGNVGPSVQLANARLEEGPLRTHRWSKGWGLPCNYAAHGTLLLRRIPSSSERPLRDAIAPLEPQAKELRAALRAWSALLLHAPQLLTFDAAPYLAIFGSRAFPAHPPLAVEAALFFLFNVAPQWAAGPDSDAVAHQAAFVAARAPHLVAHLESVGCGLRDLLWGLGSSFFLHAVTPREWAVLMDVVFTAVDGPRVFHRIAAAIVLRRAPVILQQATPAEVLRAVSVTGLAPSVAGLDQLQALVVPLPPLVDIPPSEAYYPAVALDCPEPQATIDAHRLIADIEADEHRLRRRDANELASAEAALRNMRWGVSLAVPGPEAAWDRTQLPPNGPLAAAAFPPPPGSKAAAHDSGVTDETTFTSAVPASVATTSFTSGPKSKAASSPNASRNYAAAASAVSGTTITAVPAASTVASGVLPTGPASSALGPASSAR